MTMPALKNLFSSSFLTLACTAHAVLPAGIADELLQQLRKDVPEVGDCEPKQGLPFHMQQVQLSTGGGQQYLLTSKSECMCGQVNCTEWIYRRGVRKWELLLETQGYSFTTRESAHYGYRDVAVQSRDNAARVDTLVYVFDGKVYQSASTKFGRPGGGDRIRKVQFAAGTSSIRLEGSVSANDPESWTVGAKKAQTMRVYVVGHVPPEISFDVRGPSGSDGRALATSTLRWEGSLPETGTYTIHVDTQGNKLVTYTLSVDVR